MKTARARCIWFATGIHERKRKQDHHELMEGAGNEKECHYITGPVI